MAQALLPTLATSWMSTRRWKRSPCSRRVSKPDERPWKPHGRSSRSSGSPTTSLGPRQTNNPEPQVEEAPLGKGGAKWPLSGSPCDARSRRARLAPGYFAFNAFNVRVDADDSLGTIEDGLGLASHRPARL